MRQFQCEHCGSSFPLNSMFEVYGHLLCEDCGNIELAQHGAGEAPAGAVVRQVDRTVCRNCGTDNGTVDLPLLAGMPVCPECEDFYRHRPFPMWVKLAFLGLLGLVAFSFFYNLRFFQARMEALQAARAARAGDFETASILLDRAAGRVPEAAELRVLADQVRVRFLLDHERAAEALQLLQNGRGRFPAQE